MKNLTMNAPTAGLDLTHKFPYQWDLKDIDKAEKNGATVFSCFSCGGGSSMGYKLAGFDVVGNCEIDPLINKLYIANNHPKYNYQMDIRKLAEMNDSEIPDELFHLDILDGSPPCSTFSMAGNREKSWGKEKVFKEGQAKQILDDLFFWFIKVVNKLKPNIFVAENVKGLLNGNAKGYVNQIIKELESIGYDTQIFLLNSASMGVPQRRERVFFIGHKKELNYPKLKLNFHECLVKYSSFMDDNYIPLNQNTVVFSRWKVRNNKDRSIGDTVKRTEKGKVSGFTTPYLKPEEVPRTLTAGSRPIRFDKPGYASDKDILAIQSFPRDYNFLGQDPVYVCGMSVPPVMMANIAKEIYKQWIGGPANGTSKNRY